MKRLWTAPFSLRVAAVTAVALLVGHLLLDRKSVSTRLNAASLVLLAFWVLVATVLHRLRIYIRS